MVASRSPYKGASQALAVTHARRSLSSNASKELPVNQLWLALVLLLCLKLPSLPLRQSLASLAPIQGDFSAESCPMCTVCTHKVHCMFLLMRVNGSQWQGCTSQRRTADTQLNLLHTLLRSLQIGVCSLLCSQLTCCSMADLKSVLKVLC